MMSTSIKAVIFDLDQTLLDRSTSLKNFIHWQTNFLQLVPEDQKSDFINRFIELDANGSVWKDRVYAQLIQEFEIKEYSVNELLQIYIQDFNKFSTSFLDVEETIKKLNRNGIKLGLISNGKTPFQEHNFRALGIHCYFQSVLVSEAVGLRKPDPAIFQLACEQLAVKVDEAIFIGDNYEVDIEGGRDAGLHAIYFKSDLNDGSIDQTPISTFKQLLKYLENNYNLKK